MVTIVDLHPKKMVLFSNCAIMGGIKGVVSGIRLAFRDLPEALADRREQDLPREIRAGGARSSDRDLSRS